jgi:hypothetical protein
MCEKCQQLKIDIQCYRKRLAQGLDTLAMQIRRSRKLSAIGLDPLTIVRIERVIQKLVQHKRMANRFLLQMGTGSSLRRGGKAAARRRV